MSADAFNYRAVERDGFVVLRRPVDDWTPERGEAIGRRLEARILARLDDEAAERERKRLGAKQRANGALASAREQERRARAAEAALRAPW